MLRKALVLGLALSPGLAGPLVALATGPFFAEDPPGIAGAPFSAVVKTQSATAFADGNRIVRSNTVHYFRDGQGRNGVTANGTRLVRTIPSGVLGNEKPITSTLDRWVSTDLGIAVQITQKSSIGGELTLNLEQVARTEPDPTLFAPPSDYTRRDINLPGKVASMRVSPTVTSGERKDP